MFQLVDFIWRNHSVTNKRQLSSYFIRLCVCSCPAALEIHLRHLHTALRTASSNNCRGEEKKSPESRTKRLRDRKGQCASINFGSFLLQSFHNILLIIPSIFHGKQHSQLCGSEFIISYLNTVCPSLTGTLVYAFGSMLINDGASRFI